MTNIHVLENKVSALREYLQLLQRYKKYSRQQIEEDVDIRGALERYLYLAAQSAIDLAEAIISFKQWRKPSTMGESFMVLKEAGVVSAELANRLAKMAGFRNVMAHDYVDVDYDVVYDILHHKLDDLGEFSKILSKI